MTTQQAKIVLIDNDQPVLSGSEYLCTRLSLKGQIAEDAPRITRVCADRTVDLIAVGNHRGYGLVIVETIPAELRDRVVVLSNRPLPAPAQKLYQQLGVRHFCLREAPFRTFALSWATRDSETPVVPTNS